MPRNKVSPISARYSSEYTEPNEANTTIVNKPQNSNALRIKLDHMETIKPLSDNQKLFMDAYNRGDYFIASHGVAGSGKSFLAIYKALEEVLDKSNVFDKVVIVRSSVQGREQGHLPGDASEKMAMFEQPYIQICETLFKRKDAYQRLKEQHHIEFISTSFIRGMSFDNAIVIADEIQNFSFEELDTTLTRIGHQSKIIFCGDYRQTDLKKSNDKSGLPKFFEIVEKMKSFTKIEFTVNDIIRSSLVKEYIIARLKYEDSL